MNLTTQGPTIVLSNYSYQSVIDLVNYSINLDFKHISPCFILTKTQNKHFHRLGYQGINSLRSLYHSKYSRSPKSISH